jgi:hypothetical protein
MTFWDFLHAHFEGVVVFVIVVLFMFGFYKLISKDLL